MADDTLYTVQEAAEQLGVTDGAVRIAVLEGRLGSVYKYGRKLIPKSHLEEYRQRTRPHGEKPKGRPKKVEKSCRK